MVQRLAALAGVMLIAVLLAEPAAALGLVPHRASYHLSRRWSDPGSDVLAVEGRLEVRYQASCEGWTSSQFLGFRLLSSEDGESEHLARLVTWESADGRELWFDSRSFEDREPTDEAAGVARLDPPGGGEARYSRPEPRVERLPPGTLFPVEHINALIEAAAAGRRRLLRPVFDGSTSEGLYEVSAFFGRALAPRRHGPLAGLRRWPVRLAYFPPGGGEPLADFEMSLVLYENGVAGEMVYDYGDFTVSVEPHEVEIGKRPSCP